MGKEFSVTPYSVKGEVDYTKLVKDFGVSKIDEKLMKRIEKNAGEIHFMLRRGIFFAHRDLNWLLDEYEKGNKFFLYTGRGPSGDIHLGHPMPWVFTKWLQDKFGVGLWFQFTDDEKFLFGDYSYEELQKTLIENMIDVAAMRFDLKKTHFLVDTQHAGLMYPEACKVAKKITFSMVKASFGMNESSNIGSIFYTSMQAVPAFLPSVLKKKKIPCLIPHAVDQDPHFRITRDILPKLGHYKPASIQCSFLPPLQGKSGKMSSSDELSAIYLKDSPKEVERKINKYAFSGGRDTLEEHRAKGGNPEVDIAFQYLRYLLIEDDGELKKIEGDYLSGKLLSGEMKKITIAKINDFLKEHQSRREKAKKNFEKMLFRVE